ncbi:MAG TPA: peptidylprolyl isomerase, partial [Micromonosporaceae bacterium]|nr:peptidylprolyl isomerase [Micromonosporaceae bacterium]
MASSKDRQRKLARAKLDRQMARRAATARRRRQIRAAVGAALALVLIVLGSVWALGGFDRDEAKPTASSSCEWTPQNPAENQNLKDVGTPPTEGIPTSGTRPMTINTSKGGPIVVDLDLAGAPCAAASFAHLAGRNLFDNTKCHEITTEGAVRCGDPSGTGQGGPTYTFFNEYVPQQPTASASPAAAQPPAYPAGTVAMIGTAPGANGSQFLMFFKDFTPSGPPSYPIIGRVTNGLDVVKAIGAVETVDNGSGAKVKPKSDVVIESLTVGEAASGAPSPEATGSASPPAGTPGTAAASPSA